MKFAITVIDDHISPRSTMAQGLLLLAIHGGELVQKEKVQHPITNSVELINALQEHHVDTLVCGGNDNETLELLKSVSITVIDNVAGDLDQTIQALQGGGLMPGYGLLRDYKSKSKTKPTENSGYQKPTEKIRYEKSRVTELGCLSCRSKACRKGKSCQFSKDRYDLKASIHQMLESAFDINFETERVLCRVAELVYFLTEMNYKRIGLAYCVDLDQQTKVLANVLDKFFDVRSVCCKVQNTGHATKRPAYSVDNVGQSFVPCNPVAQAEVLNQMETQFNVMVGLCIGCDSIFTQTSHVPVSTLFVKDRMLANNPIGAIYSDYYISDILNRCNQNG